MTAAGSLVAIAVVIRESILARLVDLAELQLPPVGHCGREIVECLGDFKAP